MLLGGVSLHAAAKAQRQFAMPCSFVRIAPMGDGGTSCSVAAQCPGECADRQKVPRIGSERVDRKALTGHDLSVADDGFAVGLAL